MKKQFAFLIILHFFITGYSQSFEIKSGEELTVSKGSVYMRVLLTEETDVYVYAEEFTTKKVNPTYTLYKYDKNMTKIYENNFNKYIGDRFVFYVQSLQGRIYLFTSEWKKDKYTVYGIEIDKNTGKLIGE